jgi:hypothetical protein
MRLGIDVQRVVGTGLHAGFAADAAAIVKVDNPVVAPIQGRDRANLNAGGVVAVIAPHYRKESAGIGEFTLLNVFDPSSVDANRNVVLRLAGHRAGVAADTATVVDDETQVGQGAPACGRSSEITWPTGVAMMLLI